MRKEQPHASGESQSPCCPVDWYKGKRFCQCQFLRCTLWCISPVLVRILLNSDKKGDTIMRKQYKQVLRVYFRDKVFRARVELDISQEEMAHRLALFCRSYVDLEHGESCCSAVTLALFLMYFCQEPLVFLERLRYAFEAVRTAVV